MLSTSLAMPHKIPKFCYSPTRNRHVHEIFTFAKAQCLQITLPFKGLYYRAQGVVAVCQGSASVGPFLPGQFQSQTTATTSTVGTQACNFAYHKYYIQPLPYPYSMHCLHYQLLQSDTPYFPQNN